MIEGGVSQGAKQAVVARKRKNQVVPALHLNATGWMMMQAQTSGLGYVSQVGDYPQELVKFLGELLLLAITAS